MERGIFGDTRVGAAARRDHLLKERREQLGVMPLEVRRIYVRRIARTATGITAFVGAAVMYLEGHSYTVRRAVESLLPGMMPAVVTTTLLASLIAAALAYFVARAFAEDYFTRAMMAAVTTSMDLHGDVQRLANVHPHAAARRMAARAQLSSVGWATWGALSLFPFVLAYLWSAAIAGGFPPSTMMERALVGVAIAGPLCSMGAAVMLWTVAGITAEQNRSPSIVATVGLSLAGVAILGLDSGDRHWYVLSCYFIALPPILHWFRWRAMKERRRLG